ncbi:MAG: ATP synthase F1 subunit epsilon [Myxococcota bacterium]
MALELTIVTPAGAAYAGPVDGVVLPGTEGDFGVLPDHERFLCPLRVGEVQIQKDGSTVYASVADGFADVSSEAVAVLVDSCELGGDIDTARAELALQRAEQGLSELGSAPDDEARLADFEAAVARARNRLAVSQR